MVSTGVWQHSKGKKVTYIVGKKSGNMNSFNQNDIFYAFQNIMYDAVATKAGPLDSFFFLPALSCLLSASP